MVDDVLAAVVAAKAVAGDPFAPVTVVTGLGARRLRLELGRRAALANVRIVDDRNLVAVGNGTPVIAVGPLSSGANAALAAAAVEPVTVGLPDGLALDGARVVSCPDATVEARVVADALRRARAGGMAWSSMAVALAMRGSAGRMVDALGRAEIPFRTRRAGKLSQTVAGRFVLGICDAVSTGWSRAAVSALWASVPLVDPATGSPVPWTRWEARSRTGSAVVSGADWALAGDAELEAFIGALRAQVGSTAAEVLAGLGGAMTEFLPVVGSARWQTILGERAVAEGEAADDVRRVVIGVDLVGLADIGELRCRLEAGLEERGVQGLGRVGEGVQIDRPEHLALGDFGFVAVTGLCEPSIPRDPDARARRLAALALLCDATGGTRLVTVPRADPRAEREVHAAPALLDGLGRLTGRPVTSEQIHDDPATSVLGVQRVDSFSAALLGGGSQPLGPLDADDVAVRALQRHVAAGGDPAAHPNLDQLGGLARTLVAGRARAGAEWTAFDGRLSAAWDPTSRAWSVSSLQSFHRCPLQVFVKDVLGARPLDVPEESAEPTAQTTGTVVHSVLERLARRWLGERESDGSTPVWSLWLAGLDDGAVEREWDAALVALRAEGVLRPGPWWDAQVRWLRNRMRGFLVAEARDDAGFLPLAVEAGATREHPWVIATPVGRLAVTGRADRVDVNEQTRTLRVIDYKTGRLGGMKETARSADVLDGGRLLQLPLYAAMHMSATGPSYERVLGVYVNPLRASARDRVVQVDLTGVLARASETVAAAAARMGAGDFRYRTGNASVGEYCRTCDVKACCPAEITRMERRKAAIGISEIEEEDPVEVVVR